MSAPTGSVRPGHLWPVLSLLTVFTYNTWVWWKQLNGQVGIFNGYLSEFSASDQPANLVFRGGDLVTAIIVAALGVRALVLWRSRNAAADRQERPRSGRWWAVAAVALLVFGAATFFDAFFAMDCAPSLSQACLVAEETGQLSLVHYTHTLTSVGAQVGIVASMIATSIAMVRSPRQSRARGRVVLAISVFEVVALAVMLIMIAADLPGLGYPQAVMVAVASGWFGLIGFGLVGEPAPDDAVPGEHDPAQPSGREVDVRVAHE